MLVTAEKVSPYGVMIDDKWYNVSSRGKKKGVSTDGIRPGPVELEGVDEFNGKMYFEGIRQAAGGNGRATSGPAFPFPSSSSPSTSTSSTWKARDPVEARQIVRQCTLKAATDVFTQGSDKSENPYEYITNLAAAFEDWVYRTPDITVDEEPDFD